MGDTGIDELEMAWITRDSFYPVPAFHCSDITDCIDTVVCIEASNRFGIAAVDRISVTADDLTDGFPVFHFK